MCLTGSDDSTVRLWDLRRVEDDDDVEIVAYSDAMGSDGEMVEQPNGVRNGSMGGSELGKETAFVRALEGHSKAVTSMYFEDECLVSSDIPGLLLSRLPTDKVCRLPVPPTRRCASGISRQDSVS